MDWRTFLFFMLFFVAWFGVNRYVLPYFGINTCCSSCTVRPAPVYEPEKEPSAGPRLTSDAPVADQTKRSVAPE